MGERAPSVSQQVAHAIPRVGVATGKGCLLFLAGSVALGALLEVKDGVDSLTPQMVCVDIPTGMGPEAALRAAGGWDPVDPFPIDVKVASESGYINTHRANTAEDFYGPFEGGDYNFSQVPDVVQTAHGPIESQVCYDSRPPRPTPISILPKGRDRHLIGTKAIREMRRAA